MIVPYILPSPESRDYAEEMGVFECTTVTATDLLIITAINWQVCAASCFNETFECAMLGKSSQGTIYVEAEPKAR